MRTCCLIASLVAIGGAMQAAPVSPATTRVWLRHVIPLPKEIRFEGFVKAKPSEIAVDPRPGVSDVEQQAADLLTKALGSARTVTAPRLRIVLGVCDRAGNLDSEKIPGAERLSGLKNSDQAYVIAPMPGNRLVLTGLTERGVYYAAVTLAQLLKTEVTPDSVTVPRVRVVDWPDLAERGEWGGNASNDIAWMSALKLNLVEAHARLSVSKDGVPHASFSQALIENARLHALKIVPIIMHLDQIARTGILAAYPQLKGLGKQARHGNTVQALCFSKPEAVAVLAGWMTDLAKQPHVTDLSVWLSENAVQCQCRQCAGTPQHVLEARACVAAWREARKVNPDLKLRLLLTQGSYKVNAQVLAAVPPEVNISYYDGGRTYDSSRDPMIYPLLENYAASGHWLGVYPQLTASWRVVCPWSGPRFIKFRMTEFVDKHLSNFCGYATPNNRLYDFNVTAAAEWSWNAHGRDPAQFAAAWATRRGIDNPGMAAEWAMTLGKVGWDVYGSRVPYNAFFGAAAHLIRDRAKPVLGKGMFRYFDSEAKLREDLQACRKAAKLAAKLKFPEITFETQVISGYVTMLDQLYNMASLISRPTPPSDAERAGLQHNLTTFAEAEMRVSDGLRSWEKACLPHSGGSRLRDTIQVSDQTVADVSKALVPFGVRNPLGPYLITRIGGWQDSDFEANQHIVKTFDVTRSVYGPGNYHVRPVYTKGWNGLNTSRVALVAAPKNQPDKRTVVVEDRHTAFSGARPKNDLYTLNLPSYNPDLLYFVIADIHGTKSSDKPEGRRGCNGIFNMWKVHKPGEQIKALPLLPMSDAEKARYGGPKFTKGGLHVAVVEGGYGAAAIRKFLQGKTGLDVQPLFQVTARNLRDCQAVILTQPYAPASFTPAVAKLLTQFVHAGGGLITTHNAVGFKGLPVVLPEVCAKGADRVDDNTFEVVADHPVTKGLPKKRALKESYYDCVTLEPGPAGTVLARGGASGGPAVVCGKAGKGRYVACGLGLCINPNGDTDCPPTAAEGTLLEGAVKWVGGK